MITFPALLPFLQVEHKIKYYATPIVRSSVTKLSALLGRSEDFIKRYFEIYDLKMDRWNNVNGMQVKPFYSPHPVETTNFQFRVISEMVTKPTPHTGRHSFLDIIDSMINTTEGINSKMYKQVKKNYLEAADVKKIDIGGGMIHGMAKDFKDDESKKVILSHINRQLTPEEKEIGEQLLLE